MRSCCLQLFKHKKLWRIIKSLCPCLVLIDLLCGAWTVGLVIRGLYAISCLNTDGWVSFILLSCRLGVSRKDFQLCERWILKSVNFSICICTQFMNIFSTQCMHILSWLECDQIIFQSPYKSRLVLRHWLKSKKPNEDFSPRTSKGTTIQ